MKILNAFQAPAPPNPHGVSARPLHDTEHVQVTMVTLEAGDETAHQPGRVYGKTLISTPNPLTNRKSMV